LLYLQTQLSGTKGKHSTNSKHTTIHRGRPLKELNRLGNTNRTKPKSQTTGGNKIIKLN